MTMNRSGVFTVAAFCIALFLSACGDNDSPPPAVTYHAVGGTVSGLTGTGLLLQNNGADDLLLTAGSTTFTFATKIAGNSAFNVTVVTHPTGTGLYEACEITNGSGVIAGADVTNVLVSCSSSTWEVLASPIQGPGFSDFTPAGQSVLYTMDTGSLSVYSFPTGSAPLGVFTALTGTTLASFISPAWVGGTLYQVIDTSVLAYNIAGDSWTRPVYSPLTHTHDNAQCTADSSGFVYTMSSVTGQLLKYNTANSTFQYYAAPAAFTTGETRAAWDSRTSRVYLGYYGSSIFYSFNPADGSFTALASIPIQISDAFCSDRRGHIFTSSPGGTQIWMYTAATDSWSQLPGTPFAHSDWESCTVSADGWLYYSGGNTNFARFKVF